MSVNFLIWGNGTPLFIIECKGSQTSLASVVRQLRRGLEQLPSIDVGNLNRVAIVVATHLRRQDTVVHVIDPTDDEPKEPYKRRRVDDTIDKLGNQKFVVSDLHAFREKLRGGVELFRLRWAGQHATAEDVVTRLFGERRGRRQVDNARLERVEGTTGEFLGTSAPLAPELLRPRGPQLFRGIRADLLLPVDRDEISVQPQRAFRGEFATDDPRFSEGGNGTCLAVLDLEM